MTRVENMKIGQVVNSCEYGIGIVEDVEVGLCKQYVRARFNDGKHRVKSCELTEDKYKFGIGDELVFHHKVGGSGGMYNGDSCKVFEYHPCRSKQVYHVRFENGDTWYTREDELSIINECEHKLVVGDRVHAVDEHYDYFGIITYVDNDDLPYYVQDEDDRAGENYFRSSEVTYAPKHKFNVGDMVHTTKSYRGEYIVGIVKYCCIGASIVKTGGCEMSITNTNLEIAKPKFNIGDKITGGTGTVHTITGVRPSYDGMHICYDSGTGTIYECNATLYVEPCEHPMQGTYDKIYDLVKNTCRITKRCDDTCPFHNDKMVCIFYVRQLFE